MPEDNNVGNHLMRRVYCFSLLFLFFAKIEPQEVLCAAPIAEGLAVRLAEQATSEFEARALYRTLATCSAQNCNACPRICQLLLHQKLILIDEQGYEAFVEVPGIHPFRCWMLKENIVKKVYGSNNSSYVILTQLLSDPVTGLAFSAGTRFLIDSVMSQGFQVVVYNKVAKAFEYTFIPSTVCITEKARNNFTHEQKKNFFMQLITDWIRLPEGFFSCVSGGCSITKRYRDNEFYLVKNGWERPRCNCDMPYTGVDMSGLVLLATQIAGIPYWFRNADDAVKYLSHIDDPNMIQDGDLIWIPGSFLVVSDVSKNKIITTLSYEMGYGMVVEMPLSRLFQGVQTFNDFRKDNLPLEMYNKDGTIGQIISEFQFLKLSSVFDCVTS